MIETLTDIPGEELQGVLLAFAADGAVNVPAWNPALLTEPTTRLPGIYRQNDGGWTVMLDVPAVPGGGVTPPPPKDPPPEPTDPATAKAYDIPKVDPLLSVESPTAFTIHTNLKQTVSTLTAAAIDNFFAAQKPDHRNLRGIGQPVIDAARKYGINASYIVAHAILESGWGNSHIANLKKNLFGWSAFDARPDLAKGFKDFAQCIDFVMGRVNALYLDSAGRYFNGGPYVGDKRSGMNVNYAAESDWGTSIASIAREMGAKIVASSPGGTTSTQPTQKTRGTRAEFVVSGKIPGGTLQIPRGVFSLIADDGKVVDSINANTGGFVSSFTRHNGPIPPGSYRVYNYRAPRRDEGAAMRYFDVSFSFSLEPLDGTNVFGRDGLDIHPDGPPPGTHGCIGLVAQSADELEHFRDLLRAHTSGGSHLNVTVRYTAASGVS